jgi:radical SAM superfamily enzyme YgiQ (UPF0313 family)
MSREEMDQLGWDSCDIIIVTGDAYVDHPSFGMAIIGRLLESQGFRVGIIAQPNWQSKDDFMKLGEPNLFFGVAAGNMDSMINRYTADKKIRSDDAYTPGGLAGKRPDRASLVYSQRCKEAYKHVPIVLGGIEASLRRIAHYDYWQDKVRNSILIDASADILLYGNAERAIVEVAQRLSYGDKIETSPTCAAPRSSAATRRRAGTSRLHPHRPSGQGRQDHQPVREHPGHPGLRHRAGQGPAEDPNEAKVVQILDSPDDPRQDRDPPAVVRKGPWRPGALCPRQPRAAPGDQPGQRPRAGAEARRSGCVVQPAAHPDDHRRNGLRVRHALRARPHPAYGKEKSRPTR